MGSRKALLIVNPLSGTREKESVPAMLREALAPSETDLLVEVTGCQGDALRLARQARNEDFDMVVVAGGDGTVNDVANVLRGSDIRMGIVPCGSGNGLARSLGIPMDFRKAVDIVAGDKVLTIDCGEVNGRPFFCTFGMGFDAAVSKKFAAEKRRGKMTYVKNTLSEFLSYHSQVYAISLNGNLITERAMVVAVCNASQYGNNAFIAPEASLCDGLLDITVIHDGSPLLQAVAGLQLLSGHIDKNILVDTFRVSQAEISRLDSGPAHIDGEPVEMGRLLKVECCPSVLQVMASPEVDKPFKPVATPLKRLVEDITTDIRTDLGNLFRNVFPLG